MLHPTLSAMAVLILAAGPEMPLHKKVSVEYRNRDAGEALKNVGEKAGVRFVGADRLLEGTEPVTYVAKDQEAGRVATRILRPGRLRIGRIDGDQITVEKSDPMDEFRVKRVENFEFAEHPTITREGDKVTLRFAVKDFCDATVAVEEESGRILRHLASGVLGANAPEPFQWNSKRQTVVWDGKDDQGVYMDDKDRITVRVSLGLKPQFERTLYWEPKKRLAARRPLIQVAPDGVYVYDEGDFDQLRMFDHAANYVRTIYPFAADKLDKVVGLEWQASPQDGLRVPVRHGNFPSNLLPASDKSNDSSYYATALAVLGDRIALLGKQLIRMAKDGTTGGLPLVGPNCAFNTLHAPGPYAYRADVQPTGAAFAPDGKTLYLTGYGWWNAGPPLEWLNGVVRMDLAGNAEPTVFAGAMNQTTGANNRFQNEGGTENGKFRAPTCVVCDRKGRVYVADHGNDRIQVFSPDGQFLKGISVKRPVVINLDPRNDEIWVFSWNQANQYGGDPVKPSLTHLGPFDNPNSIASYGLPVGGGAGPDWGRLGREYEGVGFEFGAALDFWTTPPTLWLVPSGVSWSRDDHPVWERAGIKILAVKENALELQQDFGQKTRQSVGFVRPPPVGRGRLAVNPKTGTLYLGEGVPIEECTYFRAFNEVAEIDPNTGKVRVISLPLHSEDLCFDLDGNAYLRGLIHVVRYDPVTWTEVPWDYGEEARRVTYGAGPAADVMSGLPLPGIGMGGMCVSPKGYLAVAHSYGGKTIAVSGDVWRQRAAEAMNKNAPKPYEARLYPGRATGPSANGRGVLVHVFDAHGRMVYPDAVTGLAGAYGVKIDRDDNLYVLDAERRAIDGKPVFASKQWINTGTLIKFKPGKGRLVSDSDKVPVPLPREGQPKRSRDLECLGGKWVEGAEWMYGGVGLPRLEASAWCYCTSTRFDLDLFGRSFAPEWIRGKVAVLDANGNLILRVGRIGNVDDGKPLVADGGPPNPRSIGGDEVALFRGCDVATHSDRRLFIHDWGNARIVSVKLGYHATEVVRLKNVKGGE